MKDEKHEEETIKVTDKRKVTAEGEIRAEAVSTTGGPETSSGSSTEGSAAGQLPAPTFEEIILQFATTASVFLGEIPDPATGKVVTNFDAARHYIDMIGILDEKTKGNLTKKESQLIQKVLTDLRILFVEKQNKKD